MAEVILNAVVDESHILRLQLPPEIKGEVEVVVRERDSKDNSAALLAAIQSLPPDRDTTIWRDAREELYRDRDAWDED